MLLQACLGLEIDAPAGRVAFRNPRLPEFLRDVTIRDLRIGEGSVDIGFIRREDGVDVRLLRRRGSIEVVSGQGFEP